METLKLINEMSQCNVGTNKCIDCGYLYTYNLETEGPAHCPRCGC